MLIFVTGVAGSGKSTLRAALQLRGYLALDADEGFCAWFDRDGRKVSDLPLELRTPEWYSAHRWCLLPERLDELARRCESGPGFLLGVAANAQELASSFAARFYLTAGTDLIVARLRDRDGAAHATRFAASGSPEAWQREAEQPWIEQG